MAKRRNAIAMTDDELAGYLAAQRTLVVATTGADARPHLTALWYVVRDGEPWIFTYARSQKVVNLRRDPQATLMIESGREYHELRGATLYAEAEIHTDQALVDEVAAQLFARYEQAGNDGASGLDDDTRAAVASRTAKRVAIRFDVTRVVSWDHRKLGGTY